MSELHVRRAMLLGWPLPRAVVWLIAAANAVRALLTSRQSFAFSYGVWAETSRQWHEAVWGVGALSATAAALAASWLFRRDSVFAIPLRSRLGLRSVGGHCGVVAGWATLGYVFGMLPATIYTASTATWGSIRPLDVLLGLAGIMASTAVGWATGQMLGTRFACVIALIATLVWMGLPSYPALRPIGVMGPVQHWAAGPGFSENVFVPLFGLLFLGALTTWLLSLTAAVARGQATQRLEPHVWMVAVLALAVTAFCWRPPLYLVAGHIDPVCRTASGVRICLHPAHQSEFGRVIRDVHSLAQAGETPFLRRVTDDDAAPNQSAGRGEARISFSPLTPQPDVQLAGDLSYAAWAHCGGPSPDKAKHPRMARGWAAIIQERILKDAGFVRAAAEAPGFYGPGSSNARHTVDKMTAPEFKRFAARNAPAIEACTFTGPRR